MSCSNSNRQTMWSVSLAELGLSVEGCGSVETIQAAILNSKHWTWEGELLQRGPRIAPHVALLHVPPHAAHHHLDRDERRWVLTRGRRTHAPKRGQTCRIQVDIALQTRVKPAGDVMFGVRVKPKVLHASRSWCLSRSGRTLCTGGRPFMCAFQTWLSWRVSLKGKVGNNRLWLLGCDGKLTWRRPWPVQCNLREPMPLSLCTPTSKPSLRCPHAESCGFKNMLQQPPLKKKILNLQATPCSSPVLRKVASKPSRCRWRSRQLKAPQVSWIQRSIAGSDTQLTAAIHSKSEQRRHREAPHPRARAHARTLRRRAGFILTLWSERRSGGSAAGEMASRIKPITGL